MLLQYVFSSAILNAMQASDWEFKNRAVIFGMIIGLSFALYSLDHENVAAAFANWLAPKLHADAETLARMVFGFAALLLVAAAFLRTWASSYLWASVVYAAQVKSAALVADGPYRHVRNPLYLANVMMSVGMGTTMSRSGMILAVVAMLIYCYRLILREEQELRASQGSQYDAYVRAVPRLWPSLSARTVSAGREARWSDGLKAESWYWGFAIGTIAFAITLNTTLFLAVVGISIAVFWASSKALQSKPS